MVSRLKGAAIDLGVAQIDKVRDVVSPSLARNLERLPIVLQGPVRELTSGRPVSELTLDGIRTVGIGFLERIEAMLDHPAAHHAHRPDLDEDDDESEDETDGASTISSRWSFEGAMQIATRQIRVPRILPLHKLRTFAMQLSNSATLKVTVLCMQDTASAVMQRLRVQDAVMKRLFVNLGADEQVGSTASTFAVTALATRVAYMGCERVLGEWLAAALFGRKKSTKDISHHSAGSLAELELIEVSQNGPNLIEPDDDADEYGSHLVTKSEASSSTSSNANKGVDVTATASLSQDEPMEFRVIVKNSFIEFDEPPPSELRRVHSWETVRSFGHSRCLNSEPFTIYARIVKPHERPPPSQSSSSTPCAQTLDNQERPIISGPPVPRTTANATTPAMVGETNIVSPPPGLIPMSLDSPEEPPLSFSAEAAAVGADLADVLGSAIAQEERGRTTVMLRNIPTTYSREELLGLLDAGGFLGHYDFVYLPVDFTRNIGLGYALISLVSSFDAELLLQHCDGFSRWGAPEHGTTPCEASWSEPRQALHEHIERYRNSPVMHKSVPDAYKPVLFEEGVRIPFPAPTKTIRPPRIRHLKPTS